MPSKAIHDAAQEVLGRLGTDPARGLTAEQVQTNRREYGTNQLTPPEKAPLWKQWFDKFKDPTIVILCICAGIAILVGLVEGQLPWDGVAILVAVCLATAGATWSEYKADKAFELLKQDSDNIAVKVTRDGHFRKISNNELVVGDLIHIEGGDKIPADSVLLESVDLMIDESLMTGESLPVHKGVGNQRLIGGTHAVIGNGVAVVTAVGDRTEVGSLASALGKGFICPNPEHLKVYREPGQCEKPGCAQPLVERAEGQTPLQRRLAGLADQISVWGTFAAVFIFIALVASKVIAVLRDAQISSLAEVWPHMLTPDIWPLFVIAVLGVLGLKILSVENKKLWMSLWTICVVAAATAAWGAGGEAAVKDVLRFFMIAVTIIVVAVPEGLPMAIFIALGLGMRKIREDNNLVRKMVAAETIGSATVICTDKTGTLTKNQMEVCEVYFLGQRFSGNEVLSLKNLPGFDLLSVGCATNSTAEVEHFDDGVRFIGNPTEGALLVWLDKQGICYQEVRRRMPVHRRVCFTADRKMMTSVIENDAFVEFLSGPLDDVGVEVSSVSARKNGRGIVFTKGAPEKVLPLCNDVYADEKTNRPIAECHEEIQRIVEGMAEQAIRPLAICYRMQSSDEAAANTEDATGAEKDLTLLAIVGMADPLREDVPQAVRACEQAGIEVKMITGDHPLTAHAIAQRIGMLKPDDLELTGEQFAEKSDAEIRPLLPRLRIISRAKPVESKARLVGLLQEQGHVVAVTGDGTNDAPALQKADVGISMGLKSTDIAKEASDIVLTDDNFGSIIRAVHWGRTLYENLQKFLQFQLTVNLSALGVAFVSPIMATLFPNAGFQIQPLTVLQYLWINLIMDTLAAVAFGLEPPRPESLEQPPKNPKEPFLTKIMLSNILVLGCYFIALILLVQATDLLGLTKFRSEVSEERFALMNASVVFNCYVWFQIFHMFNARSVLAGKSAFSNITRSRSFFLILGVVIVMQIALVEFGGVALNTAPLPLEVWLRIVALGATAVLVGEVLRQVQRLFTKPAAPTLAGAG
jgi:P-type Ca2+ transporter type 2C